MKKLLFVVLSLGMGMAAQAQDPVKDMKKAARSLGSYNLDQVNMASKLDEAIELANSSINDPLVKSDPIAWQTYGEIFMAATNKDVQNNVLNVKAPIAEPFAPAKAFEGFKMAAQLADKSYITKDAMKALADGLQNIYYMGSVLYQNEKYKNAYETFLTTFDAFALLDLNKEENNFLPEDAASALSYAAISAEKGGMTDEAILTYKRLIGDTPIDQRKYTKGPKDGCYYINSSNNKIYVDRGFCGDTFTTAPSEPYNALVSIYLAQKKDTISAEKILAEGRKAYPNDLGLLYTEINLSLAKGEMSELIAKLEEAIKLEPDNVSVYVTLGQVYDKIFQDSVAKNPVGAEEYFTKAMENYQKALTIDAKSFDAMYSIGALWYNKAASYSVELNVLANDYTPAGNKKYDAKKVQMDDAFSKAMPFFIQAEQLKPDDVNTLVALKEIYARQEKYEKVEEYKQKLVKLGIQ